MSRRKGKIPAYARRQLLRLLALETAGDDARLGWGTVARHTLEHRGLIKEAGYKESKNAAWRVYRLTERGRQVARQLAAGANP